MPKRVGFLVYHEVGHVNPTLRLARTLLRRGHEVVYLGFPLIQRYVESQGFAFRPLSFEYRPFARRAQVEGPIRTRRDWLRLRRRQRRHVLDLLAYWEGDAFRHDLSAAEMDLLLLDIIFSLLLLVAEEQALPALQYATSLPYHRDPLVPPFDSRFVPAGGATARWVVRALWWRVLARQAIARRFHSIAGAGWLDVANPDVVAAVHRMAARARSRTPISFETPGLPIVDRPMMVLCPRAFDFPRARDERLVYVEASCDLDRREPEFPMARLDGRPLILASLGTQVDRLAPDLRERFFAAFLDALGRRPRLQGALAVGRRAGAPPLAPLPSNVVVVEEVPQLQLLARAAVMVCAGGLATIKECLLHGVPMVVLPWWADQPGNAARVRYHGLGEIGDIGSITGERLGARIESVLRDPGIRRRVRAMQEVFSHAEAREAAAVLVEQTLR